MVGNCYFNYYLSFNFLINQPEMQKFLGELITLTSKNCILKALTSILSMRKGKSLEVTVA